MKAFHYEAVVIEGLVYCVECLPEDVSVDDEEVYPIFAGHEMDHAPVCSICDAIHDYMNVLEPKRSTSWEDDPAYDDENQFQD